MLQSYLSIIKNILVPNDITDAVINIDIDFLLEKNFKTLVFDIDNTLVPRSEKLISLNVLSWLEKAKAHGLNIYFLSNNSSKSRIEKICKQAEVKGFYFACKPLAYSLKDLAYRYQFDLSKTVMIGDQMLTDVVVGNWVGAFTILVDPLDKKLSFFKTFQRDLELRLLKKLTKTA